MKRPLSLLCIIMGLGLTACGSSNEWKHGNYGSTGPAALASSRIADPKIISGSRRVQCVPYARRISGLNIRGDAWSWWPGAKGKYNRSSTPSVGSVIVLDRSDRLRHGHIAFVTKVVNSREILVEHANWLNKGRIHKDQPVLDVSKNNDWSAVRLWYTPGNHMGSRVYPVAGFVSKHGSRLKSAALDSAYTLR